MTPRQLWTILAAQSLIFATSIAINSWMFKWLVRQLDCSIARVDRAMESGR
jgi:hypothetical protein